jgi:hypothetical protein
MTPTRLSLVFSGFALALAVACGDTPAEQTPALGGDENPSSGQDDDDDSAGADDSSKTVETKLDGGPKATPKVDAGVATPDAKAPVSGGAADAGATKADGGTTKTDASVVIGVDAGAEVPSTPSLLKPKCMKKDSQLMVIGDSYINWISHTFPDDIVKESGQKWRMEAIGGTSMGSGGIGFIPDQFDSSIKKDPDAHTILMDGGGNDILVADPSIDLFHECQDKGSSTKPNCQKIVQMALDAADKLLVRASAAGIRDVVYFFYPHVPANTVLSGPAPNEILDYALPKIREFCAGIEEKTGGKTRCTFVDMIPVYEGHPDYINSDIHPTSLGSQAQAKKLWEVMKEKCIGQKSGAGCCE